MKQRAGDFRVESPKPLQDYVIGVLRKVTRMSALPPKADIHFDTRSYSICSFASGRPPGVRSRRVQIGSTVPTCRGSCFGSVGMNNSSEAQLNLMTPSGPLWKT